MSMTDVDTRRVVEELTRADMICLASLLWPEFLDEVQVELQPSWDRLHEHGLVKTERDITEEARTTVTNSGVAAMRLMVENATNGIAMRMDYMFADRIYNGWREIAREAVEALEEIGKADYRGNMPPEQSRAKAAGERLRRKLDGPGS